MKAISLSLFLFFVFNGSESCLVVNIENLCTPETNTTYLFAYSNDIEAAYVQQMTESLDWAISKMIKFANVRFDVQEQEDFEYHDSQDALKNSILQKLPDPSKGFKSADTGSDIITVIQKFLNNPQAPICGSKILISLKRNPNIADINPIIALLRKYRVSIYVTASNNLLGERNSTDMYKIATQTNGVALFLDDAMFRQGVWNSNKFANRFLIHADNFNVSSQGTINLKQINIPYFNVFYCIFSVFDQPQPFTTLPFFQLNWTNTKTGATGSHLADTSFLELLNGNYDMIKDKFSEGAYNLTVSYEYNDDIMRQLYIQIYTSPGKGQPVSWIPYDD